MRVLRQRKLIWSLIATLVLSDFAFAQQATPPANSYTEAKGTGGSEGGSNMILSGVSSVAGSIFMGIYTASCSNGTCTASWALPVAIGMYAGGIAAQLLGASRSDNTVPITYTPPPLDQNCILNPSDPSCPPPNANNTPPPDGGPGTIPSDIKALSDGLAAQLQAAGVNPNDPAVQQQAAAMAASDPQVANAMNSLSPQDLAKIDKVKKELTAKYSVSGVPLEEGGGGRGSGASSKDYLADLMKSMNGAGGDKREPASVAGLQKTFGGEPIGVAGDDIFKQISRRYQKKFYAHAFLTLPGR